MRKNKQIVIGFVGTLALLAMGFRWRYGSNAPVFDEELYAVELAAYRPFEVSAWARVLDACVDAEGRVDFAHLAEQGGDLERFLRQAAALPATELAAIELPPWGHCGVSYLRAASFAEARNLCVARGIMNATVQRAANAGN